MRKRVAPKPEDISALRWELEKVYAPWHQQQDGDDRFYELEYNVVATDIPDGYEQVRPPSAKRIVNRATDFATGNMPRLHKPRRLESADAQDDSTLLEKVGHGFWYRAIAEADANQLRAWGQMAFLRGAIGAGLLFDPAAYPEYPDQGEMPDDEWKDEKKRIDALRRSAWPFKLLVEDPRYMYPDLATGGKEYVIIAFRDMAFDVKRRWPEWDWMVPGRPDPVSPTEWLDFMAYWDPEYKYYGIGGEITGSLHTPLLKLGEPQGVIEHGFGFLPYFFRYVGLGKGFGSKPEHRGKGMLTDVHDLLKVEARRETHLDAIIAQNAFPVPVAQDNVQVDMSLGGVVRVPANKDVREAFQLVRPQTPVTEVLAAIRENKRNLEEATVPSSFGGVNETGVYSFQHSAQLIAAGRAGLKAVVESLEKTVEWATAGFYKLVENKVPGPVSVWGKGMGEREFLSVSKNDIKGDYEVYATLEPALPIDTSKDIQDGQSLYEHGLIPGRDWLETYAHRENAEELMRERMIEDVAKSGPAQAELIRRVLDRWGMPGSTTGPIATPGFATGQVPVTAQPDAVGSTAEPAAAAPAAPVPAAPAPTGAPV